MVRLPPALAALVVLAAGLGVRRVTGGAFAKDAGDALYAMFVYTLVVFAAPRIRPAWAAAVALAISWVVEFAQLSPVPARLSEHSTLARLALGSTFHAPDLLWYAVGVATALAVHLLALRHWRGRGAGA
jgi:hypothetical protein